MTRSVQTPWSIWITIVLWSLIEAWQVVLTLRAAAKTGPMLTAILVAVIVALIAYQAFGLSRLSRWPIILHVGGVVWSLVSQHLAGFDWRGRFPLLGPFIVIIPLMIYLALTLPHWRKMNWALFGRAYRPAVDQVEVFA